MDYLLGIGGYLYLEFFIFLAANLFGENGNMDETFKAILGAGATAGIPLAGGLIALIRENGKLKKLIDRLGIGDEDLTLCKQLGVSTKSITEQIGVNSKSLTEQLGVGTKSITEQMGVNSKSLTEQLGVGYDDKSITAQLGIDSKSISEQLGVGNDDRSITAQHREIYDTVSNIYGILHDNQVRQSAGNTSQADLAATMAAFQQSYVAALNEISELKAENLSLKSENIALREQITAIQANSASADSESGEEGADDVEDFEP